MENNHGVFKKVMKSESGFTMIITLMILLLLTVLGVAAMNTSVLETMISSADLKKRVAFNAAEAGIDHASTLLKDQFYSNNQQLIQQYLASTSGAPKLNWDFALTSANLTSPTNCSGSQWTTCFNDGDHLLTNQSIGNNTFYTVSLRNNNDSGGPRDDTDGIIYVNSLAVSGTGNSATRAAIEIGLSGYMGTLSSIAAYTAQMGAGAGKSSNATDLTAVSLSNLMQLNAVTDQAGSKVY